MRSQATTSVANIATGCIATIIQHHTCLFICSVHGKSDQERTCRHHRQSNIRAANALARSTSRLTPTPGPSISADRLTEAVTAQDLGGRHAVESALPGTVELPRQRLAAGRQQPPDQPSDSTLFYPVSASRSSRSGTGAVSPRDSDGDFLLPSTPMRSSVHTSNNYFHGYWPDIFGSRDSRRARNSSNESLSGPYRVKSTPSRAAMHL